MQDSYFEALGIKRSGNEDEEKKYREAYDKAHDIRKFEIEMYWRRSAYLWTLQGAALAGLALILSNSTLDEECLHLVSNEADKCRREWVELVVIVAIWCFGIFTAFVWLFLLRGAKFWQNNWERHVDLLEDRISGALYKTYPVKNFEAPYSVSKLNELMAGFTFLMWILIGVVAVLIIFGVSALATIIVPILALSTFLFFLFEPELRMSEFGEPMAGRPKKSSDETILVLRGKPRLAEKETQDGAASSRY